MNKWYTKEVKINDKEHTKEMKDETVGAVRERERERELQFSKINIEENGGKVASICDREKDRKQTDCINQEDVTFFLINMVIK